MDSKGLTSKTRSNTMTSIHIGHDISPIAEFDRMGYEHAGWFRPAN